MKRILSTILALVMLFTVMSSTVAALADDVPTIKVTIASFTNAQWDANSLGLAELQNRLGIKLDFTFVDYDSLDQTILLDLAGDTLPDFFGIVDRNAIAPYYDYGVVQDVSEVMYEKMPNLVKVWNDYGVLKEVTEDDGRIFDVANVYGLYMTTSNCNFVNKEWLAAAGYAEDYLPATTDELLEMLRKFKACGKEGYPMTAGRWIYDKYTNVDSPILNAFGSSTDWMLFDDGTYTFGPYGKAEEFKQAMLFLNTLYTEGLLDPEFLTHTDDDIGAMLAEGKIGFQFGWVDNDTSETGAMKGWVRNGVLNRDTVGRIAAGSPLNYNFYINANSPVKEDVYRMIDYICSEEGQLLFSWGIKDVTYTEDENGEKRFTDMIMNGDLAPLNQRRLLGIQPQAFFHVWDLASSVEVQPEGSVESMMDDSKYAFPVQPSLNGTEEENDEVAQIMTDIYAFVGQSIVEFINGTTPIEENFDAFLKQLEDMNVQRAIEIKQAQYARYQAR